MAIDRRAWLAGLGGVGLSACIPGLRARASASDLDLSSLEVGGRIGVQAVRNGRAVSWRAHERFTYCSTFKLFLAAATLERVQAGDEQLDRPVAMTAADMVSHAPVTGQAVGGTLTIQALCQATVEVSDNPAANILIREMGGLTAWRDWYRRIGDTVTNVDRLEPELNGVGDARDTTTPGQFVANLQTLFADDVTRLSSMSRSLLMSWLFASPSGPNRLRAGVPVGWEVAHKTGTSSSGPVNDIGLLIPPGGHPIHIAVFWQGRESDDFSLGEAAIAEATRRVVEALS